MTQPRVSVRRERHHKSPSWYVACEHCRGFVPWAYTKNHAAALLLARWHAAEHARTYCSACNRHHKIGTPHVQQGDATRFTIGTRRFRVEWDRVVELVEVSITP